MFFFKLPSFWGIFAFCFWNTWDNRHFQEKTNRLMYLQLNIIILKTYKDFSSRLSCAYLMMSHSQKCSSAPPDYSTPEVIILFFDVVIIFTATNSDARDRLWLGLEKKYQKNLSNKNVKRKGFYRNLKWDLLLPTTFQHQWAFQVIHQSKASVPFFVK